MDCALTGNSAIANYEGPETVKASRWIQHFARQRKRRDLKLGTDETVMQLPMNLSITSKALRVFVIHCIHAHSVIRTLPVPT